MGTYEELKAAIQQVIRTNGNNEITGALLQNALLSIVNVVGANATFAGIATPNTNPGTADQNVFYLATEAGTYVNFGGIEINMGEAVILSNKTGNWVKTTSGFATQQQLTELELEVNYISGSEEIFKQTLSAGTYPQINISRDYAIGDDVLFEVITPNDLKIVALYEMSADGKSVITQHSINAILGRMKISDNYQGEIRVVFAALSAPTQVSVKVTNEGALKVLESKVETLEPKVETLDTKVDFILGNEEIIEQTLSAGEYPQINISRNYKPGDVIRVEVLTPDNLVIGHLYEMSADGKNVIVQHFINATVGTMEISENYQGRIRILFAALSTSTKVSVRITNEGALKVLESDVETLENKVEHSMQQIPRMNSLRIIKRVGCIGDSYTQGHIQLNGQSAELKEEYSWPFFLSQITGNTYSNWGIGGSTAKDWINSLISVVDEPNNKCQAYIIGLGINDGSSWSPTATQPGDSTDIGTDNDVYIAYYYKIVQRCLSVNPLAKVFCQTMPNRGNNYNAAIRSVVDYCNNNGQNNVILVDLAQDKYAKSEKFYKNPYFLSDASEGHYTAIGYEFMAECLYIILSDIIKNNISEFQNIHQIPYDEIVA